MSRFFKLHHHKHTGKLIHHRHTSYGALFAVLIMGGIMLAALTVSAFSVKADDNIYVTAVVPAPIPTGAPAFTAPVEGFTTDTATVQFEGTCPIITPAVVIGLYEGSTLLGSSPCSSSGTFAADVQLTAGTHTIVATVITITNGTGDSSTPLHVTYTPPTPPVTPVAPTTPPTPGQPTPSPEVTGDGLAPVLQITSDKPFILFRPGVETTWSGTFGGGSGPYKVIVDWGDGTSDTYASDGTGSYHHTYSSGGSHSITVTITDQAGYSLMRNFAAVDTSQPTEPSQIAVIPSFIDKVSSSPVLQILVVYAGILILLIAMWRYEFLYHRRTVGVPTHYGWQRAGHKRK